MYIFLHFLEHEKKIETEGFYASVGDVRWEYLRDMPENRPQKGLLKLFCHVYFFFTFS